MFRDAPRSAYVQKFLILLKELQYVDPEFPLQYSICLAEISMNEGLSLTQLSEKTGLSLSTVSRIVGALSDYRKNKQPYGFIKLEVSKQERRRKELYLTEKGVALMEKITEKLEEPVDTKKTA